MKVIIISLTVASVLFTGCGLATHPDAIMPKQEVNKYMKYSCADLAKKANEITSQTIELRNELELNAATDSLMFTTGMLVAWPALATIQGDAKDTTELYSKIKGELLNIQEADILKECHIKFSEDTLSIVNVN